MKTRLTKDEKAIVIGLFKDGYSMYDIAQRYGLTMEVIERIIRQALKKQGGDHAKS
jgi:DNA-directed RNA polymerase specialized sigma subunit